MARAALVENQSGAFAGNGDRNNTKANANFAELFTETIIVPLVANATSRAYFAVPAGRTVAGIKASRGTVIASALGTVTLGITESSGGATLLSTATIDAEALTATPTAQTLTGTTGNLALIEGELIVCTLISNNADATGGPAIVIVTFAAA